MEGALIILCVTVAIGLLLYIYDLQYRRKHPNPEADAAPEEEEGKTVHGEICCGRHLICEKSLTPLPGEEIIYYDDEELDRFSGKDPEEFSATEVEEIREVMMTLLPEDVAGWVRSMQLRGIHIPLALRDELFLLLEC